MKTKITFLALFIVSTLNINAQQLNVYYHAKYLADIYYQNDKISLSGDVKDILEKYYPTASAIDTHLLNSNPFYKDYFEPAPGVGLSKNPFGNIPSSIGGLNVTNFADGLAKFLVERMKEELSAAFFEKFKNDLNNPNYGDLKILFPVTWKTLMTIDKDVYQYSSYLNTLRQSFIKDMTNQYVNLQTLLKQPKYNDYFTRQQPELGSILRTSLYFINQLSAGKHPGDVLANYDTELINLCSISKVCKNENAQINLRASIQTIQLLSESFRSTSTNNYWVPADSVRMLVEDSIAFKIYLGLLYQQTNNNKPINFSGNITLKSILDTVAQYYEEAKDSINVYRDFIQGFAEHAEEVNEHLTELKSKKKSEIDFNDYYKLFNGSLDLLEQTSSFIDLPYVDLDEDIENKVKSISNKILYVARSAGDLYVDVRTKNYSSAILNAVSILDTMMNYNEAFNVELLKNDYQTAKQQFKPILETKTAWFIGRWHLQNKITKTINEITKNEKMAISRTIVQSKFASIDSLFKDTNNQDLIIKLINIKKNLLTSENKDKLRANILKYGSFIAAVAQAQNSDEVKNAIQSVALPSGSYSIKQKSACNIAVNGYIGYAWDFNQITSQSPLLYSNGFYAPVGISLSHGFGKKRNWGSGSLFLSIIDVGGLAAYRISNETDTLKQEIKLQNIISPSAQFIYGIPKVPISICLGWRMTPTLFYSGVQSFKTVNAVSVFNISILVDIPLLNIKNWTKQKSTYR